MSRLIDADALIKEINEGDFCWIDEDDKSFLIYLINRQHEYDIDEKVKRLEILKTEYKYKALEELDKNGHTLDFESMTGNMQGLMAAIKIVKGGTNE